MMSNPNTSHGADMSQSPTIGRILAYRLKQSDVDAINRRRTMSRDHSGNGMSAGDVVPLIACAIWPEEYATGARLMDHAEGTVYDGPVGINGQAFLDGNDSLWVTSAPQHSTLDGCWFWPPKV